MGADKEPEELGPVQGTSIRVHHHLGWDFEVVGPNEWVRALWKDWLAFLQSRLLVTAPSGQLPAPPPEPALSKGHKPRTKPHWTQLPENKERVAAMVAKRHPKPRTRTCTNCGTGVPVGKPCVMCGTPEPIGPRESLQPAETPKERVDRALDLLRKSDR